MIPIFAEIWHLLVIYLWIGQYDNIARQQHVTGCAMMSNVLHCMRYGDKWLLETQQSLIWPSWCTVQYYAMAWLTRTSAYVLPCRIQSFSVERFTHK